jgi:dolichyl-phosphate beta-glucosyltransferase
MSDRCIVVPCYNEEKRFDTTLFLAYLDSNEGSSFLFVNDGSTDDTMSVLNTTKAHFPDRIEVLDLTQNGGKAEAVRQGMMHAKDQGFKLVGFIDADLSTPLTEMTVLFDLLNRNPLFDLSLGSRIKRMGATIIRNPMRHYLGRVFSTMSSRIINLPVYDTQCGAKAFRAEVIELLCEEKFITKWLFDVELLMRYKKKFGVEAALKQVFEYPLKEWREVGGSKIKLSDMVKVPYELLLIHRKYNA